MRSAGTKILMTTFVALLLLASPGQARVSELVLAASAFRSATLPHVDGMRLDAQKRMNKVLDRLAEPPADLKEGLKDLKKIVKPAEQALGGQEQFALLLDALEEMVNAAARDLEAYAQEVQDRADGEIDEFPDEIPGDLPDGILDEFPDGSPDGPQAMVMPTEAQEKARKLLAKAFAKFIRRDGSFQGLRDRVRALRKAHAKIRKADDRLRKVGL